MLDFIRRNAGSWFVKVLFGAIVLVFIFWGIGSFRSERLTDVGTVNGEKILRETYRRAYSQAVERYQEMFQGKIPQGFLEQINLRGQIVDSLVNEAIVRQEAERLGVLVSDQEVQAEILKIPAFQKNGLFDNELYQRALRSARLTAPQFEGEMRKELLMGKLASLVHAGLDVTEEEALGHFRLENSEIDLSYVKMESPGLEKDVKITDEDLAAWFETARERYKTAPRIAISYLLLKKADLEDRSAPSGEAVSAYYQEHIEEFRVPEERQARHILVKVPENADANTAADLMKKAAGLLERAQKGEDFAKLAKESSDDPGSAKKGGDLGMFPRGAMVKPFEDAVFDMKEGETRGPVRTPFGWHVIKLEKIQTERTQPIEEVGAAISKRLASERAERLLWEKAHATYDEIMGAGGLETYAGKAGLRTETTGLFDEAGPPAFLKESPEAVKALFSLGTGEMSSLLSVRDGVMVAEVVEKQESKIPALEEVRDRATGDFRKEKALDLCREKARSLLDAAREKGLSEAAASMKLKVQGTGFFRRSDTTGGKLPLPALQAGTALSAGKPLPDQPVEVGTDLYVIAFREAREGDASGFPAQREGIKKRLLAAKEQTVLRGWIAGIRKHADIRIAKDLQ